MSISSLSFYWYLSIYLSLNHFQKLLHRGVGEGATPFPGLLHFTPVLNLIMLSVKQVRIKYHFLSLWYDTTWDWNPVSRTIGEHSTQSANGPVWNNILVYNLFILIEMINRRYIIAGEWKVNDFRSKCLKLCKIYWCREIQNTDDSPLFRCETFINFSTLVFRHEERETQFLLCWLFLHRPQSTPQPDWPAPESNLNSLFFKITKFSAHRFRAWRHSHPSPIFLSGFFLWHLWLSYPLRAIVNCTQWVCTCTKSGIVHLVQCEPDEASSFTNPNVGPGTYANVQVISCESSFVCRLKYP